MRRLRAAAGRAKISQRGTTSLCDADRPQRFIGALLGTERTVPVSYRVRDEQPCDDLAAYVAMCGGEALDSARRVEPAHVIHALKRSGLRGRGGAGFPTEAKWSSILTNASPVEPTPVVINGAEGEPSTFKDRAILRNNPFRVL